MIPGVEMGAMRREGNGEKDMENQMIARRLQNCVKPNLPVNRGHGNVQYFVPKPLPM